MEDNIRPREASTQEGKAHDQETQTTFDINGSIVNCQPPGRSNTDRNHSRLNSMPWSGRYPPTYPDNHYPYDAAFPTPPSPHHGHGSFYPGKSPHWHHPDSAVVYPQHYASPMPPPHIKQNEYPRRNYFNATDVAPQHRHVEIARPKPEWPARGPHHPFPKPLIPSHYLASVHGSHRNVHSEYGGPPSTATSLRSTVLDVSGSNISSPRGSAHMNRKRTRSNTPSSIESIDLNMIIRNSPDSLLGCLAAGSRISSAGSFGHLSPLGFCTSSAYHRVSSAASRPTPFITPPPIHPAVPSSQDQQRDAFPSSTTDIPKREANTESMSCSESPPNNKTANGLKMKEEAMETKLDSTTSPGASEPQGASDNEPDEGHGEVDEPNLTCQWRECTITFDSQADLVNHVNGDHIKKEKRDFTCYWKDCCREQKPFKAQYMLVVHMRRHTGEKPHVCTYAGCTKAYSRLENLKTHLRSHTGERPYVCEVEGCSKAFSNASDRAKHQNRTHSSIKPYICKVPGCPKRYTDPSSLRKHTKTVHGDQGVKRLKSDTNKETPNNSSKTTTNQSNKPVSNNNSSSMMHSPSSELKSPASGSSSGTVKKVSGYTSSIVSSTCDVGSPAVDIPCNNEGSLGVSNQPPQSGLSPRSPPYVNNLPGIAEGDYEPGVTESASTTIQSVVCERQSQTVTLPKIHNKSHDIASWVSEVHRRMSQTSTRRSSEGSHLSVDLTGDASRRSSESGWASNNESRRSSQTSLVPHPPNAQVNKLVPRGLNSLLPPMTDSDDIARRASETSNTSSQSLTFNRQSRSSSGYGSHPRSPMFHRMPYVLQKDLFQYRLNGQNRDFRRSSDTVICEADSSDMSRKGERGEERRRRSEPTQTLSHTARPEPQLFSNFMTNEAEPRETELINDVVDPKEFDAYLNPEQIQSQMARETQPLRHFPYPPDYPNQHPMESQTIHYRPNLEHLTRTANQHYPTYDGQSPGPNRLPRYNPQYPRQEFYQKQQRLQTLPQGQMVLQYQQRTPPVIGYYGEEGPMQGDSYGSSTANYEDILNGMEGLSTNGGPDVNAYSLGNGNMVINDMNTLLNSLIEEDKYLEIQQNTQRMAGSSMSGLF